MMKGDYTMSAIYAIFDLIASLVGTFEPNAADELAWLYAIFGMFK